ncbi:MAG: hypothetical protein NUV92_02035 [Ignavibacteria bacterium]|jgi:hypothetical protein|nr:hypothetical protein [Ignavibacteria bacterium]MDH7527013.1 hypothetical protein [Ignavibacteria bacterium]
MFKKFSVIIFLVFEFSTLAFSQTFSSFETVLKQKFENFDYNSVISLADSILKNEKKLSHEDSLVILYYKAISSFTIWDIKTSEQTFRMILSLDKNFTLDSINVSPKIISYFNDLKSKFVNENRTEKQNNSLNIDSLLSLERRKYSSEFASYRQALWRNLILPGWGDIYLNNNFKGYLFSGSFTLSFISSVYYIFDTKKKENDYLSEINPDLILEKYSKYNSSYKLKNIFIALTLFVYIYSQVDFLISKNYNIQSNNYPTLSISEDSYSTIKVYFSLPIKF